MKVAILGLGVMGQGVARTLLRDEFDVTVWNRSSEKAAPFADEGAVIAETPAEAVAGADVILSIVFDADSVLTVLDEASDSVAPGAIWVQATTVGIDGTARVAALAEQRGVTLIEAMMVGTKAPAESGALVMLTAGPRELVDTVRPVLDSMGSKTVDAGSRVGAASALKLAANAWIASITAATAQSIAITEALGLDPELFLEAIRGGAPDSPYAQQKGSSIIAGDFAPSFALDGLRKDIGLIADASRSAGVNADLLDALSSVYATASSRGHGADDIAAVSAGFRPA